MGENEETKIQHAVLFQSSPNSSVIQLNFHKSPRNMTF